MLCTVGTATCVGTTATLYCMLCTAGTAATLYCMLHTAGTATCVSTATALYCMLCTVGTATAWVLPPLYTVCYALLVLPHAWVLPPLFGASLSEPHINVKFMRLVCLSVCLSVCPYVHDTKIYKNSSDLRGTFSC